MHWKTKQKLVKWALGGVTFSFLIYQWGPILTMAVLSFTGPEGGTTFPMRDVSLHWYREFLRDSMIDDFKPPMLRSFLLALACSITTAVFALSAAQAMRSRFRGHGPFFYLILIPTVDSIDDFHIIKIDFDIISLISKIVAF